MGRSRRVTVPRMRYPIEPLEILIRGGRSRHEIPSCPWCDNDGAGTCMTDAEIERRAGMARATLSHWRSLGVVEAKADEYATTAGLSPYEVWPDLLDNMIEDVSRRCDECATSFVPHTRVVRFCSARCRRSRAAS